MRQTITDGTMKQLNVPYVKVAGKSGTAQLGISKKQINSWAVGFFPFESPLLRFLQCFSSAVLIPRLRWNCYGSMADWMNIYASEYLSSDESKSVVN